MRQCSDLVEKKVRVGRFRGFETKGRSRSRKQYKNRGFRGCGDFVHEIEKSSEKSALT